MTLTEGRYHQVRRMFAAMGNHVTVLHRDRIGGLDLPADLAPGQYRIMPVKRSRAGAAAESRMATTRLAETDWCGVPRRWCWSGHGRR